MADMTLFISVLLFGRNSWMNRNRGKAPKQSAY